MQDDAIRPLAIELITETWPPEVNGVAMTLGRLAEGLVARGHRLRLVRPRRPGEPERPADARLRSVRGGALPLYRGLQFGYPAARRLRADWTAARPDLVHVATEGPLGWSALRAAHALGLPVVSSFHTHFHSYTRHYGLALLAAPIRAWLRHFHRRCALTLAPTAALAAELAEAGFGRTGVLGRGIDTARFDPAHRDPRLRAAWGAVDDAPVVLGVGRLAPEKNWALVLQAWAAIRSAQPRARLVLAGEGPMRACLRAALPEASFCGELPPEQLAAIYASADLFLFPSLTETWGNVTAEAMASGLAVVAYRRAGAAELIRDGVSGALAEPGDAAGFIGAALALAADRERCRRLGAAARQVTLGRDWDAVVLGLERSYHDVLNGRHGHGQRALDVRFDA